MPSERDYVDVDALVAETEKELAEETPVDPVLEEEHEETDEVVEEEVVADEPKDEVDPETKVETPDTEVHADAPTSKDVVEVAKEVLDPDAHKRNEAFKQLREERDKFAESDKLVAELAGQYGLTKEELIIKLREDKLKKSAEAAGVPVEWFKKTQELELEVARIKEERQRQAFNYEADRLVRKYNLKEDEAVEVFKQMGSLGLDLLSNPHLLDFAYKATNFEKAQEKTKQAALEELKKARSSPSPTLGTKGGNVNLNSEADEDAEIAAYLKEKLG